MPKVLIVSEEDPTPDLARTVLWGPDVERLVASSTTAAFEIAPVFLPSLVVLQTDDKVTALGLLKRLREAPGTRRSSLVVLTRTPALSEQEIEGAGGHLVLRLPLDAAGGDGLLKKLLAAPRRVRTRFPVRLAPRAGTSADQPVLGLVLDASVGGMLVEAAIAPRLGETLDLSFTLPGNRDELCATAEVVRLSGAQSLARLGLRFLTLAGEVRERIQDLMDAVTPSLLFGRYEAVGPLGEGSMGRVYRGFDPMARRVVAIKTLRPELLKGAEGEEYLRRFQTEAQAAARLVHPNIITIFDVGHDYFVMELLEGQTLQTVMRQRSRLWPDELRRFLGPVAEALDYAHGQGTIHRDIKPSNIMVLLDSRPKLMDFGIAHLMSEVIKASEQLCGSPAYMAPEQITGGTVTPATDLFSLAAVAYEALTGRRPFEAKSIGGVLYRVAYDEPTPPTLLNSALPATSDEVFRRALAKEPEARFASATEFLAALDPGGGAMQAPALARPPSRVTARLTSDPAETIDLKKRNRLVLRRWSAAISSLCALGLGGAWLGTLSRPKPPPAPPGLQVSTSPAGATVRVDGREAGRTPLFLTGLSGGAHSIRVVHKEYAPAELTVVTASEGPPMPLRFTLWPVAVGLRV
ncbi:MAG TPA: protein kinase, partial [Vicinamibacteria bacterium]|nr:protein kinase [Vicinamibacteria bacterium]